MRLNVKRKVREINLNPGEFLLPLYEVVVNAVHAIDDSGRKDGRIEISIDRDTSQIVVARC